VRKLALTAAIAAMLPVCAAQAQSSAGVSLSAYDPKFDTPRCRAARQRAARYAEESGRSRFFVQSAWFLALGSWVPPGTYDATPEQQAIDRALRRHCVTAARR
jgi:hypothetical protein